MKIFARLLMVLVLVAAVVVLLADRLIARYAKQAIEESTGFGFTMDEFYMGVLNPVIRVKNLTLTNPSEFPHPEAISVRELSMSYDRTSLFSDTIQLHNVVIDVPKVVMVRTPEGSNFDAMSKAGKGKPSEKKGGTAGTPGTPGDKKAATNEPARSIHIDELTVRLGEMEVRQYRRDETEPKIINIPVDLDRSYSNVTNVEQVAIQLGSELVVLSGISLLRQLDPMLKKLNEDSKSAEKGIKKALDEISDRFFK